MWTFIRRAGFGLFLLAMNPVSNTALLAQAQKTMTVPKCQNCTTQASKGLQGCMASGGGSANAQACQKTYQKKMTHCNKKWCAAKTTKVKVNTASQ